MRVRTIAGCAVLSLAPAMALARAAPVDLQPVSAAVVRRHLQDLAAVFEHNYPYLKRARERARFEAKVNALGRSLRGRIPTWREWLLEQELIRTLDDPHAELGMNILENRALAVELHWVSNGLLVSPAPWMHPALFAKNSELLRIGGRTPAQLLPRLEALYAGTPGWVAGWPGFMLRYAFELRWLGLLGGGARTVLVIRTPGGRVRRLDLAAAPLPDFKALKRMAGRTPWFSWSVDKKHNIGWFTLESMRLTVPYERAVARFFAAVERAGITRVVVDLRHNGGGNSLAEAPFMQYLGVRKVRDYTTTVYFDHAHLEDYKRKDEQAMKKLLPPGAAVAPLPVPPQPRADQRFHGRFFVVTGPGSFSSAMDFAADVKFNHLGTIVGRPCGERVRGTGNVKWFPHPASGMPFQVPTDIEDWPGMPRNAVVTPDVSIPLTVREVQEGIDPVRRWFDTHEVAVR